LKNHEIFFYFLIYNSDHTDSFTELI